MEKWDSAIEEAIRALGVSFDSHRLIQEIAHRNQRRYVMALEAINSDIPFQILHSQLGRQIKVVASRLGFVGEESRSPDMFAQNSECMKYSRR
jgi:hypothetical protein